MLDTSTLERLRASLADAIAVLDERAAELERERVRKSLRVVGGRS
jgi:hypothetical protein